MEKTENSGFYKILFKINKVENYPPVDYEYLWAKHIQEFEYKIDSIPFFVKNIAIGDTIEAMFFEKELHFKRNISFSGHTTVRVVVFDKSMVENFREGLIKIGCSTELSHLSNLFSVDIPPEIPYSYVRDYLDENEQKGLLNYEEAALGQKT